MTLQIILNIIMFACCVVMFVCNRKLKKCVDRTNGVCKELRKEVDKWINKCNYIKSINEILFDDIDALRKALKEEINRNNQSK